MKEQHIAKLEAHLERLVEGAFSNIFGKKIRAQDIALRLTRAMEDHLRAAKDEDQRPFAPDKYAIYTHPEVRKRLLEKHPDILSILAEHMLELATRSGYRLTQNPEMELQDDERLDSGQLMVIAEHSSKTRQDTVAMRRVDLPVTEKPQNPQLIIDDNRVVALVHDIVNIGRSLDNHVVLDDPHISRHHIQLRLRFGAYTLFDVNSQSGTFVNDVEINEHRLQSGDVIRVGKIRIIYVDDTPRRDTDTAAISPIKSKD